MYEETDAPMMYNAAVFPKAKAVDRVWNPFVGVEPRFTQSRPAQGLNQQPKHVCYRGIRMNSLSKSKV
jgi:hypothetical protein